MQIYLIYIYICMCVNLCIMFLYGSEHLAFEITVFSITDCEFHVNICVYIHKAVNGCTFSGLLCFI